MKLHKIREYRKLTPDKLALLDEERSYRRRPFYGFPALKTEEPERNESSPEWKKLRAGLAGKTLEIGDDCMDLSDEELVLLSKLYAILFFFTDEKGERFRENEYYQERLDEIGDELDYCCRTADNLNEQSLLIDAISNFSRIRPYFDTDFYKDLMQEFVKKVESTHDVDYKTLHIALKLLQLV